MPPKKKTGLGKGLDALIAPSSNSKSAEPAKTPSKSSGKDTAEKVKVVEKIVEVPVEVEKIVEVPVEVEKVVEVPVEVEKIVEVPVEVKAETILDIDEVEPNRVQPRTSFDDEALQELADSIKIHGIIQPIIVVKKDNYYEIIAGERRWRAARIAGLKEVPVIIKDYSGPEALEVALIENIQREDLNPIEEAQAYQRLIDEFGLKQEEAADRVSKSRAAVTNSLRLLKLDERVRQMIVDGMISAGHGRTLLPLPEGEVQYNLAMRIFDHKLSVRETEKLVKNLLAPPKEKKEPDPQIKAIYESLENRITQAIGSKVQITPKGKKKGRIEIEYYSEEELERIVALLESTH